MLKKLRGLLIEDLGNAWRYLSLWLAAFMVFLDSAHDSLPIIKEYLPDGWVKYIAAAVILSRLIRQRRGGV